jgi:malonyl-CoA O-methyltransferase
MQISTQFSKYATHYGNYNVIQEEVADKLLSLIKGKPKTILDLGCGSGAMAKRITWEYKKLIAVDFAEGMLELHPKSKTIECLYGSFDSNTLFENLQGYQFDYIISSSALQWAQNLENVFKNIVNLQAPVALAIFSANTFKTLNKTAKLPPLLRSHNELKELQMSYFPNANFELVTYNLEFNTVRDIFRYIKKSGVSGSRRLLGYKETKRLMQEYPIKSLEFEVVFIYS